MSGGLPMRKLFDHLRAEANQRQKDMESRESRIQREIAETNAKRTRGEIDQFEADRLLADQQRHLQTTRLARQGLAKFALDVRGQVPCLNCLSKGASGVLRPIGGGTDAYDLFGCDTCEAQERIPTR